MNRLFLILTLLTIIVLNGCTKETLPYPTWNTFISHQCNFSILMPGIPTGKSSIVKGKAGTVNSKTFTLSVMQGKDLSFYMVICAAYPHNYLQKFSSYKFLEKTWKDNFGDLKNRMVYEKKIKFNNYPAIEFQYKDKHQKLLTTSRYYLIGDRTYLIAAITSKVGFENGYANKYLDSFQILK